MRNYILFLLLFLSLNSSAQITIMETPIQTESSKIKCEYDSLTNFTLMEYNERKSYHHLIGQTILYCDNYYSWKYDELKVGHYYKLDDVFKNTYCDDVGLSLIDITTNEKIKITDEISDSYTDKTTFFYNSCFVVKGFYEKVKSLYLNNDYIFTKKYYDFARTEECLINVKTGKPNEEIPGGSIWKCIDVQVRMYQKGDSHDLQRLNPLVLVLYNPDYGKYYYYVEGITSLPACSYHEKFAVNVKDLYLKSYYEHKIKQEKAAEQRKKSAIIAKYGKYYGEMIYKGEICIGMSKQMCKAAWGEPQDINTTTTQYGSTEQWVYWGSYVYFEGGKISAIQD